jgi:hypothetical protein
MTILYKKNGTISLKIYCSVANRYPKGYISVFCRKQPILCDLSYCTNHIEFVFDPRLLPCGTYGIDIFGYNADIAAKTFMTSETLQILN